MNKNIDNSCFGFWITRVYNKLRNSLSHKLKKYDLTIEQRQILLVLYQFGAMSQRELCEKTFSEPSNITVTLNRMKQRDLISKLKHPNDNRALLITPTKKALKLKKELQNIGSDNTLSLLEGIEPQKQQIAIEVLQQMYQKSLENEITATLKNNQSQLLN